MIAWRRGPETHELPRYNFSKVGQAFIHINEKFEKQSTFYMSGTKW